MKTPQQHLFLNRTKVALSLNYRNRIEPSTRFFIGWGYVFYSGPSDINIEFRIFRIVVNELKDKYISYKLLQLLASGNRNAAISSLLRTTRTSPANAGWFHVLPLIAGNRASSLNWSAVAPTSASSPFSDNTSKRS